MSSTHSEYLAIVSRRIEELTRTAPAAFRRQPGVFITAAAVLGLSSLWLRSNYLEFKALGPGGLPYDVRGWLMALVLKAFSRETLSTAEYDADANKDSWLDDREGIPRRQGARPSGGFHVVPARQLDQVPSGEMFQRLDELFDRVVRLNPGLLEYSKSPHEKRHNGIVVKQSAPASHHVLHFGLREVGHIHPSDHSVHVIMAPQDCKFVIERGWGERHKISGSRSLHALPFPKEAKLPKEYIWIYAPRDERELAVMEKILVASARFMTNTKEINY
ncbi:uncharacterized protein PHACADRAFT_258849 [Phanerochaete carnosa HHB-10118-sp]|uniref:Luciferase domain-containing protein n=1 Tax=Phanerochaete carnosa (strain HHB-10118-sp) TaxID=650164 RepID=K5VTD0_PHACS|nr:uncharacterized protein PHACADRAFT_258849 [Phanerochaete carnosa HHB-10118-sp]EKM54773.1 hypothetical protein PHACADRAFT_258849 [Phanerochaete carnosa HHB-10118-sp]